MAVAHYAICGLTLRSTPFASLSGRCAMKPRSAGHLERWAPQDIAYGIDNV